MIKRCNESVVYKTVVYVMISAKVHGTDTTFNKLFLKVLVYISPKASQN